MSFLSIAFPPASKFSIDDIPDLTGKVIIVTGANAGVGKETAKALLVKNATVYMGGRSAKKLDEAVKELRAATGKEGIPLVLDLADLRSVKHGVDNFLSQETRLDVLFNNAGVMQPPIEQVTAQGYDLQFGTNVIGHWYLTKLLLPILLATAKATGGKTRVVHTSSSAAAFVKRVNFDTFKDGPTRKKKSLNTLYSQSKLGNIMIANEFAKRFGDQGLISCSCDPGLLKTELQRHNSFVNWSAGILFHPAPMGALTQLWAGTTDEGLKMNSQYLIPWARYGKMHPGVEDGKQSAELWTWLETQVKELGL